MNVVLSIAGSDSSGGAGIQADLKTFEAFGVFGCSVISVLTAQNTKGVSDIYEVDPLFVKQQLKAVFEDFDVKALKIGMLFSNEIIEVVKACIKELNIPIVLDPVFISKANCKLLNDDAIENMKTLFEYVTVITPNLYEANALFPNGLPKNECNYAIVIKNEKMNINGHDRSLDTLYHRGYEKQFDTPFIQTSNTHGTGCSFSSAIAANLAWGYSLGESIQRAKKFIYLAIKHACNLGEGKGPIAHKVAGEILHIDKKGVQK